MTLLGLLVGGVWGGLVHFASRWAFGRFPERGPGAVWGVVILYVVRLGLDALGLYALFRWGGESLLIGAAGGLCLVLFAALWREKLRLERGMAS